MPDSTELCVIGGAGRTGSLLIALARHQGHPVTTLVRDRTRVQRDDVRVVVGDATDQGALRSATSGVGAVVSVIAASDRGPTRVVSDATRVMVEVLSEQPRPGRLVITSSRSLTATRPRLVVGLTRRVFRHVYADLASAEQIVQGSGLDWCIARATRLVDGPGRGGVWTDRSANAEGGDWVLPRADYAATLLAAAFEPEFSRVAVGVNGLRR